MELVIIMLFTVLLAPLLNLHVEPLRIALGAVFLLFFPGYTLMAALFPRKESMQAVERVVLSFVLSMAVVPLTGLVLNYTPWGIRLVPIYTANAVLIFIFSLIALYRRRGLAQSERFEPHIRLEMPRWQRGSTTRLDKAISVVLVLLILGAVGALVYVVTAPRTQESFTDFYVLGQGGKVGDYPKELVLGDSADLTLGVVNHENESLDYSVEVTLDGERVHEIGTIHLADGDEWQQTVNLAPTKVGDNQKAEFLLYKGDGNEPYLTLYLWLDVKEKQ